MSHGRFVAQRQPALETSSVTCEAAVTQALREYGALTRTKLAGVTGWSRATISTTVQSLLRDGQVSEERSDSQTARGRPATLVRMNPVRADVLGLEIGRGHVAAAAADGADLVIAETARSVSPSTTVLERTTIGLKLLADLAAGGGPHLRHARAIAVGTPGPQFSGNAPHSTDAALTQPADERAQVVALLSERLNIPVGISNNTRCTALGEATSGVAGGARDMLYLRVDEGIGGGVVADGAILEGHWGTAGEFGHVTIDSNGKRCACGGRGCLETIAAMPVLLATTGEPDAQTLTDNLQHGAVYPEVNRAASSVAQVLAGALATVDSSIIVLGGSVALLPGFLAMVKDYVFDLAPSWCRQNLSIRAAEDDRTAGARGCLVQARSKLDINTPYVRPCSNPDHRRNAMNDDSNER